MAGGKGAVRLGQHAAETVALIVLGLAWSTGGTVALAAVLTQIVPVIQPPAIGKLRNVRRLIPKRCEEVISGIAIIVATQSVHLALEACGQAQCQLAVPVVGDRQPKVQLHYGPSPTLVHTKATLGQGSRQA